MSAQMEMFYKILNFFCLNPHYFLHITEMSHVPCRSALGTSLSETFIQPYFGKVWQIPARR